MFVLQPSLAAITLAPVPLVIVAAARYGRRSRPALQEVQQRIAELTAEAEESISGIRVVKAFAREHEPAERFRARVGARVRPEHVLHPAARVLQPDDLVPAEPRAGRGAAGRRPPGRQRLDHAGRVRHLQHLPADADVPDAACSASRSAWRSGRSRRATACSRSSTASRGSIAPPDPLPLPAGRRARATSRRHVRLRRRPRPRSRRRPRRRAGETVAIVGPTGSGKTTLVAALARLYDVTGGAVPIDGVDVRDLDPARCARTIALVPEDGFLFSATVAREHRLRAARTRPSTRSSAPPAGADRPTSSRAARRLRHAGRRARPDAVGRPAPAGRDRARAARRPAHPDPRRRDRARRRDHRARDQGRAARGDGGAHHLRDRPPAVDDRAGRRSS